MYLVWKKYGHWILLQVDQKQNNWTLSLEEQVNLIISTVPDNSDIPGEINKNNTFNGAKVWKQHTAVLTAGMEHWYCAVTVELLKLWLASGKLCSAQNDVNARVSCHWLTQLSNF